MPTAAPQLQALPSLEEIRQERERRQVCPASPAALAESVSNGRWQHAPHLDLLDGKLVDLARCKTKRLIVTMPPRHGKSQLCSKYFPAWFLGMYPDSQVILCSYEAGFAAKWGGEARDLLARYGDELFGVSVSSDTSARDDWRIEGREGGMITAGVGGPITGYGAKLFIIDDPIKNSKEANSVSIRQSIWDWWQSTALTRLEPDAVVLVIQTRWHKNDLVGSLLREDDGEESQPDDESWELLNLPAIAEGPEDALGREEGEALWKARWPADRLMKRKRRLGGYVWGALFQQRPTDPEGSYFKREWFKIVPRDRVPQIDKTARVWDLAATPEGENGNDDPDFLAGVKMSRGADGRYYVFDCHTARTGPKGVEDTIKQYGMIDGRSVIIRIEQEGAASGKIVKYHYERMMNGWDCRFTGIPRNSKFTRSGPYNAACERGDVILVEGAWNAGFIDEHTTFSESGGAHDDQVDAAVGAYEALSSNTSAWDQGDFAAVFNRTANRRLTPSEILRQKLTQKR